MTTLHEVGGIGDWLADTPLAQSYLWNKTVEIITPTEMIAFLARFRGTDEYAKAHQAIDVALHEIRRATARGDLEGALVEKLSPPDPMFTIGDLRESLAPLTEPRRRAVLFALDTGLAPSQVEMMSWREASKLMLNPLADSILKYTPRHINLDVVFWEELMPNYPTPVLGVAESVQKHCGLEFDWLAYFYARMRWVDLGRSDEAFKRAVMADLRAH